MRGALVGQAIFTSVRGAQFDGYQLAAHTPGLSTEDLRELARWGPAHDSLPESDAQATSVNFHSLSSGLFCVSKTSFAGCEYSARGGLRVYTQTLLVEPETLARFTNHAFRVLEAATAAGRIRVLDQPPRGLEPFPLVGRASPVNVPQLTRAIGRYGASTIASLAEALDRHTSVGVLASDPRTLLSAALDLTPVDRRTKITFSTGLSLSPQRPFRLVTLHDPAIQRRFGRQADSVVFDPAAPPKYPPNTWAKGILTQIAAAQDGPIGRVGVDFPAAVLSS